MRALKMTVYVIKKFLNSFFLKFKKVQISSLLLSSSNGSNGIDNYMTK